MGVALQPATTNVARRPPMSRARERKDIHSPVGGWGISPVGRRLVSASGPIREGQRPTTNGNRWSVCQEPDGEHRMQLDGVGCDAGLAVLEVEEPHARQHNWSVWRLP